MDKSEQPSQHSPKSSTDGATTTNSTVTLQRANSSFATSTTSPPSLFSNGSPSKISSQEVRQRLKEHLSRRVMSVEASWTGGSMDTAVGTPPPPPPSLLQARVALRHFSRSFDSDPMTLTPSPPNTECSSSIGPLTRQHSPPHPSLQLSLPRKRAVYHRSTAMSLDSPFRPPAKSAATATLDEVALATLNTIWREGKLPAHCHQTSLGNSLFCAL